MDKRKGIILAIVLFLIIGLGTFVFAGSNDKESGNGTSNPQQTGGDNNDSKNPSNTNNEDDGNTNEEGGNNNTVIQGGNNGNNQNADGEGNDDATVIQTIDYKALLEQLANKVASATNKNGLEDAEQFRKDNNITADNIASLNDTEASKTYEEIIAILNDNSAPVVTPSDLDGAYFNSTVKVNVTDDTPVTSKLILNDKEVTDADLENLTAEGTYELTVTDSAFNSTTVTFTIDVTAPLLVINGETVEPADETLYYNEDVTFTVEDDNYASFVVNNHQRNEDNAGWTASGESTYNIVITDKAGNTNTYKVIVDKTAPKINVVSPNKYPLEVGSIYEDKGYSAIDNVDGDITDEVTMTYRFQAPGESWTDPDNLDTSKLGTYKITYHVTDKAGNKATATRVVEIVDTTAPVVTVINPNKYQIELGSIYEDKGYSAIDNYDGDITDKIEITYQFQAKGTGTWPFVEEMDTNKLGTYKIIYTVTDSSGNTAKGTRVVEIVDTTAPIVSFPATHNYNKYYNVDFLSITITDKDLKEVYYTWANTNKYVSAKTLVSEENIIDNGDGTYKVNIPTIEGRNRLNIKAVDGSGNVTTVYSSRGAYNIDKTAPEITLYKWIGDGNHQEIEPSIHNYCVIAKATDKNLATITLNGKEYSNSELICDNGSYELVATDKAGLTKKISFEIDTEYSSVIINDTDEYNTYDLENIHKYNVIENMEFSEEGTVRLSLNDEVVYFGSTAEFAYTFVDGIYKVELFDKAGNPTLVMFELDSKVPQVVELRINSSNKNKNYANENHTVGIYLVTDEKLGNNPIFTINGIEYKMTEQKETANGYFYAATTKLPADTKEGKLEFKVDVVDEFGNSTTFTNADIKNDVGYDYVIFDTTAPGFTPDSWNPTIELNNTGKYEIPGFTFTDNINSSDELDVDVTCNIDSTKIGEYQCHYSAIDMAGNWAGNTVIVKVVDTTAPALVVDTIVDGISYSENPQIHATDLQEFSIVVKLNGQEVRNDVANFDGNLYSAWYGIGYLKDGDYVVEATDASDNTSKVEFKLQRLNIVTSDVGSNLINTTSNTINNFNSFALKFNNDITIKNYSNTNGFKIEMEYSTDGVNYEKSGKVINNYWTGVLGNSLTSKYEGSTFTIKAGSPIYWSGTKVMERYPDIYNAILATANNDDKVYVRTVFTVIQPGYTKEFTLDPIAYSKGGTEVSERGLADF